MLTRHHEKEHDRSNNVVIVLSGFSRRQMPLCCGSCAAHCCWFGRGAGFGVRACFARNKGGRPWCRFYWTQSNLEITATVATSNPSLPNLACSTVRKALQSVPNNHYSLRQHLLSFARITDLEDIMMRPQFKCIPFIFFCRTGSALWTVSPSRSSGMDGSRDHVTFARVSLDLANDLTVKIIPEDEGKPAETTNDDLDISSWASPVEELTISGRLGTTRASKQMYTLRSFRRQAKTQASDSSFLSSPTSPQTDSAETIGKIPPNELLEGIAKPLIPTDVWNQLTGREFDEPQALNLFSSTCVDVAMEHSNNQWVDWEPADKRTASVGSEMDKAEALDNGEILAYLGKFHKEGYGSQLPVVKTRSILPLSPQELAELLMDSSRVQKYNHMSLGRTDIHVMQEGLDSTGGDFGDGETKIVRNLTKPPLTKQKMEFVTMMHARPLRLDDGVEGGGYLVVSRAVGGDTWGGPTEAEESLTRNEILLGVNLIQPAPNGDPDASLLTAVTHVHSPSVPIVLASKVGVKGAKQFVKDIRKLYHPLPANQ